MRFLINTYILICVMLFMFNIVFMLFKSMKNDQLFLKNKTVEEKFKEGLEKYNREGEFDKNIKNYISEKINKTNNLVELVDTVEKCRENISEEFMDEIREIIFEKHSVYLEKKEVEKAYYPYVLSLFDFSNRELTIHEKIDIMEFLECKSVYTFVNTMNLIYKLSDLELLEMGLEKLDKTDVFYHKKLLVDGLMIYNGDKDELKASIEKKFFHYNAGLQESLVDFCRMKKINIDILCMDILKKDKELDLEVRYSAMRYFMSNKYEESKDYFLEILNDDDSYWVEKMLAIQALGNYDEICVYENIKKCVTDKSWYIRNAAIKYIHSKNVDKNEIFSILDKHDRYTNEELLYEYRNEEEMSEYINDIMNKFG